MKVVKLVLFLAGICAGVSTAFASPVEIGASKDNTLYEHPDGALSNGQGQRFFTGVTGQGTIQRGLVAFDVASAIPAGATVENVTLQLYMSRTISGAHNVSLHRVLADWGEGTSKALGEEGAGAAAATGDATWIHRFFDTDLWENPGGDFTPEASATTAVSGIAEYEWSSPEMVADVQAWLDDPDNNFGWIARGNENVTASAKRFESRHSLNATRRPRLIVEFSDPGGEPAPPDSVRLEWDGLDLNLVFDTEPDRSYRLEWTDSLVSEWQVHTDEIAGNGEPVSITDTNAREADRRFYRVVVEP